MPPYVGSVKMRWKARIRCPVWAVYKEMLEGAHMPPYAGSNIEGAKRRVYVTLCGQ
jgi:hypothetical protein